MEVSRGKEMVARVMPPGVDAVVGFPIERLNGLIASLLRFEPDDRQAFVYELGRLDQTVGSADDQWDS